MFQTFKKTLSILVWIVAIMAILRIGVALFIAVGVSDPEIYKLLTSRYLGSHSTGYYIDKSLGYLVFSAIFALLIGISNGIDKLIEKKDNED